VRGFEEKIRELERAPAATSFSSGMAAISATLFTLLRPGDRVVSIKDSYGRTNKLFVEFLPAFGIEVKLRDTSDFAKIEAEFDRGCKLLYQETPTNPTVKVVDIERLAKAAHACGALVAMDNTFATPLLVTSHVKCTAEERPAAGFPKACCATRRVSRMCRI
jgi:cystathionine gamma-synthase